MIKLPVDCILKKSCPLFQVRGLDQSAGLYQRQSGKPEKPYLTFDWLVNTLKQNDNCPVNVVVKRRKAYFRKWHLSKKKNI